jgi:Cu(I)/Ag(I) efflux system membrane protein CusA/SilA
VLGYNLSIASPIGFIALTGVSAEFGIVMLIYLDHALEKRRAASRFAPERDLIEAIKDGAVLRVRPKTTVGGLLTREFVDGCASLWALLSNP